MPEPTMSGEELDGWTEHDGAGRPVEGHVRVHVQLGRESREEAEIANDPKGIPAWVFQYAWFGDDTDSKITAYRIVSPVEICDERRCGVCGIVITQQDTVPCEPEFGACPIGAAS